MNLQTNIQFLNDIKTSEQLNINDFIQNFNNFYEKLRSKIISNTNLEKTQISNNQINFNPNDFNQRFSYIFLVSGKVNNFDKTQIKNGYQIIISKDNNNRFTIYFRDNKNYQIQNYLLNKQNLIEILKNFKFDKEILLSKKNQPYIYQLIYNEIESNNGFKKYSIDQIEPLQKLRELVYEKLIFYKNHLQSNIYNNITDEINYIFNSESPDVWSFKINFVFININIIIQTNNKFQNELNLLSSIKIEKLILTNLNIFIILNNLIKNLFDKNKQNISSTFYQCLSVFDYLLIKILENEFTISVKDQINIISRNLFEKFEEKKRFNKQYVI